MNIQDSNIHKVVDRNDPSSCWTDTTCIDPQYLVSVRPKRRSTFPTLLGYTVFAYVIDGRATFCEEQDPFAYEREGGNYFDKGFMMNQNNPENKAQIVYFSHGGGPLPILGDASHKAMVDFMDSFHRGLENQMLSSSSAPIGKKAQQRC